MPRPGAGRADVSFDPSPGEFGPPRGGRATEAGRYRSAKRAYKAGRKGGGFSMDTADPLSYDELREFYEQGRADAGGRDDPSSSSTPADASPPVSTPAEPAGSPPPRPRPARPSPSRGAPHIVNDGAGFLLGLIGYALFVNFLRGGRAQARGWLGAKFLNRPYSPAAPAAPPGPSHGSGFGGGLGAGSTGGLTPPSITRPGGISAPAAPAPAPAKVMTA